MFPRLEFGRNLARKLGFQPGSTIAQYRVPLYIMSRIGEQSLRPSLREMGPVAGHIVKHFAPHLLRRVL